MVARHRLLTALLGCLAALVAAALLGAPAASAAPRLSVCPDREPGFRCGTLSVPLDHAAAPGASPRLRLRFATQRRARPGGRLLVALSGGPGQSSVDVASSFAASLEPALRRYRLVVLDQRGTGRSGALNCPNMQGLRSLDAFRPTALEACARRLGPRRAFYSTADTVLDLERLRATLGASKVALMGISYGTHVALQYARAFPARVDRLILDSIVGPDGPDPFLLDTFRALPRVLREQCARDRCRGVTADPVADVGALAARLARGPVRGRAFDRRGRRRTVAYADADALLFLLIAGDLNPYLQAALPAALSAARRGDAALLLRLRTIGAGARTKLSELSFGLNVTTGCLDVPLPYGLATALPERGPLALAAAGAVAPADYVPFDARTLLSTTYVDDCLRWPQDAPKPPFAGPLPDVPALLLGGRLDIRTPVENAQATAAVLPRASVVTVGGTGHDVVDSDLTGCVARALDRFTRSREVGGPCAGRTNAVRPFPRPPTSLRDFRSAPGVGGTRGRVLFAILDTALDARVSSLQALLAGLSTRGGGLRGGTYAAADALGGDLRLRRYAYVPGLRVTGSIDDGNGDPRGTVRVDGPRGTSGYLRLDGRGGVSGRLGGRAVRYRPAGSAAARAAAMGTGAPSRRADGPSLPSPPVRVPASRLRPR
jgi:pimeloyl-ACP methyl ester carboxylesterase